MEWSVVHNGTDNDLSPGVPDSPPARRDSVGFAETGGQLYLFGGIGFNKGGTGKGVKDYEGRCFQLMGWLGDTAEIFLSTSS
jgi:hypothetical protein